MFISVESLRVGDMIAGEFTVTGAPVLNDQQGVMLEVTDRHGRVLTVSAMVGDTRRRTYSSASDKFEFIV